MNVPPPIIAPKLTPIIRPGIPEPIMKMTLRNTVPTRPEIIDEKSIMLTYSGRETCIPALVSCGLRPSKLSSIWRA